MTKKKSISLTKLEKEAILAALRNGIGLYSASKGMVIDIKDLSTFISSNEEFQAECVTAIKQGYAQLLSMTNESMAKKHINQWNSRKSLIENFITKVVLWEESKASKETKPRDILIGIQKYQTLEQSAIAHGILPEEVLMFVGQDEHVYNELMWLGHV